MSYSLAAILTINIIVLMARTQTLQLKPSILLLTFLWMQYDKNKTFSDPFNLQKGDFAVFTNGRSNYEGVVKSVGSKNVVIETTSEMYGSQDLSFKKINLIKFVKPLS